MLATAVRLLVMQACFDSCRDQTDIISPNDMDEGHFLTRNCFCDAECTKYGDCCLDKALQEGTTPTEPWVCSYLVSKKKVEWDVYMIGTCPPEWADQEVDRRCRRDVDEALYTFVMDIPIVSQITNRTYVNVFCAHCHDDTNALIVGNPTVTCPSELDCRKELENATYLPKQRIWRLRGGEASFTIEHDAPQQLAAQHGVRRCRQVLDKCDTLEDTQDIKHANNCPIYANYTYLWEKSAIIYKNPCVACLGTAPKLLCDLPFLLKMYPMSESGASFALLLDFNEMHGKWVGKTHFKNVKKMSLPAGSQNMSDEATNASLVLGCEVRAFQPSDFSIMPNSSLHLHVNTVTGALYNWSMLVDVHDYVIMGTEGNASSVWVCIEEEQNARSSRFSIVQNRLSLVCISLSVTCLVAHVVIYSRVPELRNLPGRNLVSLAGCLLVAQVLFLGVDQVPYVRLCEVMAVVMHYTFLAAFFWMNVMAIDICRTFMRPYCKNDAVGQAKNYCRYSCYAWLLPAVIVAIALILDHSILIPSLSPQYGKGFCWITRRRALLVFFALPMAVLLLENLIFFVLTARGIYRTVQSAQVVRRSSDRIRFYLYVKLALLMGLGWSLGFAAAFVDSEPLWLVFILLNASQGVFILVAFNLKRKILQLVFEKMSCSLRKQKHRSLQLAAMSATNLTVAVTKISSSTPQLSQD